MDILSSINLLVEGFVCIWKSTGREYVQKIFSGTLFDYTGISVFGDLGYMNMADVTEEGLYFLGGKDITKVNAKAWFAAWPNQASDFAHSIKESFNKRSLPEQAMMFGEISNEGICRNNEIVTKRIIYT
jgi:hypothetical protein